MIRSRNFLICLWFFICLSLNNLAFSCSPDSLFLKSNGVTTEIKVEVADNPQTRKQGLMYRDKLDPMSGMFFVFGKPKKVHFWMKNTSISLDIIFINKSGLVKRIVEGTTPFSKDLIYGGSDIQYVLELASGVSKDLNINKGTELMHPLIQKQSTRPCKTSSN